MGAPIPGVEPRAIPKPAVINFPVVDVESAVRFFSAILHVPLARSAAHDVAFHVPVSSDGVLFSVSKQRFPGETPTVYFAVPDLDASLAELKEHGGAVVAGPYDLAIPGSILPLVRDDYPRSPFARGPMTDSIGRGASVQDPEGTRFGLVELAEWVHPTFSVGAFAKPVTEEQLTDHVLALGRDIPQYAEIPD